MITRNKIWTNINFETETMETCVEIKATEDDILIGSKKQTSDKISIEPFKKMLAKDLGDEATVWDVIQAVTDLFSVATDSKFVPSKDTQALMEVLNTKLQPKQEDKKDEPTL